MSKKRVMIVDDDELILHSTSHILRNNNIECVTFFSAESALEVFDIEQYPVVISDLIMPGMGGKAFCEKLLSEENKPQIIILSSEKDISAVVNLMQIGVHDYVVKPSNYEELVIKVEKAYELYNLKKLQRIMDKEREIRVEQQLNWNLWKENAIKRNIDKVDSNIIANLNTSLTQGAGMGTTSAIIEMIRNTGIEEGNFVKIDKSLLDVLYENANFTNKLLFMLGEIDYVIKTNLEKEKITLSEIVKIFEEILSDISKLKIKFHHPIKLGANPGMNNEKDILINKEYFIKAIQEMIFNALKFSKPDSTIYILFEIYKSDLNISFLNSPEKDYYGNSGIPEEYQSIVFEPFYRLSRNVFEGLPTLDFGLGLTFVEKILRNHNGKIEVLNVKNYLDTTAPNLVNMLVTLPISN